MPNFQQTADVHHLDRCEFFLSSLKCNAHSLRLPRSLGPEPALMIRANIQCDHRKVVCLSEQEASEGRDGHSGNEVGTLRRDMQI